MGTPDVFNIDSTYNAFSELLGIEDRENGGMASSMWNTHETTWGGWEMVNETVLNRSQIGISHETSVSGIVPGRGRLRTETTTRTFSSDVLQTFEQTGIEKEIGLFLSSSEEVIDLGK